MEMLLSLFIPDLDDESLQDLTRQLSWELCNEAGVIASLGKEDAESGSKGDLEIIGQILIKTVGAGGAIVALVNVLKAYIERKPTLVVKLQTKSGQKVELKADDLRSDDMAQVVQTINRALERMG